MNYAIQYHDISGDWLIFDVSDGFEIVGIHGTEKDAKRHATQLQQASDRRARWIKDPVNAAA